MPYSNNRPGSARNIAGGGGLFAMPNAPRHPLTGRPIIQNPDGTGSSERSITIQVDRLNAGRPTNIPTIWDGRQLSDDEAIERAIQSGQQFSSFGSIDEAVQAARSRSDMLGQTGQVGEILDQIMQPREMENAQIQRLLQMLGLGR